MSHHHHYKHIMVLTKNVLSACTTWNKAKWLIAYIATTYSTLHVKTLISVRTKKTKYAPIAWSQIWPKHISITWESRTKMKYENKHNE